jgi:hypothetical protein
MGADRMVQMQGSGGVASIASLYQFPPGPDRNDWNGWIGRATVDVGVKDDTIEFQFPFYRLDSLETPWIFVQTESANGEVDTGDTNLAVVRGRMIVTQTSLAPPTVAVSARADFLRIIVEARDAAMTVDELSFDILGTVDPFDVLSVAPELRDGAGGTVSGTLTQGQLVFPVARAIGSGESVLYTLSAGVGPASAGSTLGFQLTGAAEVQANGGVVTLRSAASPRGLADVGAPAPGVTIDGGFAEWSPENLTTDEPRTGGNAAIDLAAVEARLINGNTTLIAYAETAGPLFRGTDVPERRQKMPEPDRDLDTVPDSVDPLPDDFDNDAVPDDSEAGDVDGDGIPDWPGGTDAYLETVIPDWFPGSFANRVVRAYIGPQATPPILGLDTLRVFLDVDDSPASGFAIGGMYADYMVEVAGKHGVVVAKGLFAFMPGASPGNWSAWNAAGSVQVAKDLSRIEIEAVLGSAVTGPSEAFFELREAGEGWDESDRTATRSAGIPEVDADLGLAPLRFEMVEEDLVTYESRGARFETIFPALRGLAEDVTVRHGDLTLSWRTLSLGGTSDRESPQVSAVQVDGTTVVLHGFEGAREEYVLSDSRLKHNFWFAGPPSVSGDFVTLEGVVKFPVGATVSVDGSPREGDFSTDADLIIEYGGSSLLLERPYAYESGAHAQRVDGRFVGHVYRGSIHLFLTVPAAWLQHPARTYPVVLDPTMTLIDAASNAVTTAANHQRKSVRAGNVTGDTACDATNSDGCWYDVFYDQLVEPTHTSTAPTTETITTTPSRPTAPRDGTRLGSGTCVIPGPAPTTSSDGATT